MFRNSSGLWLLGILGACICSFSACTENKGAGTDNGSAALIERQPPGQPPGQGTGAIEVSSDDFIGTWTTKSCAGTFYTTMHEDGTYSGRLLRKNSGQEVPIPDGSWELRGGSLVWIHGFSTSRTKQGQEDINKIVRFSESSFTLKEINGSLTNFQKVD